MSYPLPTDNCEVILRSSNKSFDNNSKYFIDIKRNQSLSIPIFNRLFPYISELSNHHWVCIHPAIIDFDKPIPYQSWRIGSEFDSCENYLVKTSRFSNFLDGHRRSAHGYRRINSFHYRKNIEFTPNRPPNLDLTWTYHAHQFCKLTRSICLIVLSGVSQTINFVRVYHYFFY